VFQGIRVCHQVGNELPRILDHYIRWHFDSQHYPLKRWPGQQQHMGAFSNCAVTQGAKAITPDSGCRQWLCKYAYGI
jgi:hypothetical protein